MSSMYYVIVIYYIDGSLRVAHTRQWATVKDAINALSGYAEAIRSIEIVIHLDLVV